MGVGKFVAESKELNQSSWKLIHFRIYHGINMGTFPGTYHRCMVVGGLGLLVELGTVLGDKSEMLVCELEV